MKYLSRLTLVSLLLMALTSFNVVAQTQITGLVTSQEDNEPLIGATILIEGTSRGTATDIDGTFSINASQGEVLVFSYTGMKDIRITVGAQTTIDVVMESEGILIDEVVVTGYGNQLRSTYTGAAVSAPVERIAQMPRANFTESLQGNIAGLQVQQGSGQPGAFQSVRIRGLGSINAGTNPLYVIDGIPVINDNIGNESTTSTPLAGLNPQDIADIQVLKDASATSIYGSRAANGVIIITTKQGQRGAPKISANVQTGVSNVSLADDLRPLNTAEYLELMREGLINAGRAENVTEADQIIANNNINTGVDTDWFDEITQQGSFTNANLSISGGDDRTRYFVSGGYQENEGTIIGTDFERLSARLNLSTQMTDWLKFDTRISASHTTQNTVPGGGAFANPVRSIFRFVPTQPVRNPDGSFNTNINAGFNPVGEALLNKDQSQITNLLASINAIVDLPFVEGLSYEPYVSINRIIGEDETFFVPDFGTGAADNGFGENDFDIRNNWLVRNLIKYTSLINDAHGIDVTLGHEAQKFTTDVLQTSQSNFAFPSLITLDNGSVPDFITGNKTENTLESYFLNANYNYKGLFYVNGTVRRDGSSRFGANERFGTFWSAGFGINFHRFNFLKNNPTFTFLRLRSSYGVNGNQEIGNFDSRGLYATGQDYNGSPGIILADLENANLTWEVNKPFNVGIEVGLWNRVNLIVDIYSRRTSDLLFERPVSAINGVTDVLTNIGELENRGVEFQLNTLNLTSSEPGGLEWQTSFNITFNTNEVISLPEGDFADGVRFRAVGQPWSTWYMRGWAGVDPNNGDPLWYVDETETTTTSSRSQAGLYQHGTNEPDFFGGLTNTITYKGFSLSAQLNFVWGGRIRHLWSSFTHTDGARGFSTTGNLARSIFERRWQQPGDITDTPRFVFGNNTNSGATSSRFLYDGTYVSLRDVTLSYNLPNSLLQRIKFDNIRVFLSGSNLGIWVKDDRLERDPRTDFGGTINQEIPIPQTFTFGLDFTF